MNPHAQKHTITTHAKTILSGEHTVLRGGTAIVLPLTHQTLTLEHVITNTSLSITCQGTHAPPALAVFFRGLVDACCEQLHINPTTLSGTVVLHNDIAMGIGYGFSAAACALVSKWFAALGYLAPQAVFSCAHKLEHPFHSQSSGCDVMGALQNTPFVYQMDGPMTPLDLQWQPHLYLSHCGTHAATNTCVTQVQALQDEAPSKLADIDQQMQQATQDCLAALRSTQSAGLNKIQQAMTHATECFDGWQLLTENLRHHMHALQQHGALATKPTGAGGGGLVLSLWQGTPPTIENIPLSPVFPA